MYDKENAKLIKIQNIDLTIYITKNAFQINEEEKD